MLNQSLNAITLRRRNAKENLVNLVCLLAIVEWVGVEIVERVGVEIVERAGVEIVERAGVVERQVERAGVGVP